MASTTPVDTHIVTSTGNREPGIGLLSNPNSGRNRKQLREIVQIVSDYPRIHHLTTRTAGDIPAALAEFADRSVDILAVNGGDGSVVQVLTHLLEERPFANLPWLLLLPGGTTNMSAGDVGLRGNLRRAVARLCRWTQQRPRSYHLLQRPVLRVRPGSSRDVVCGMFFGAGAIIQGIEYCRTRVHIRGVSNEIGPGLAMARTVWGILQRDPRFVRPVSIATALDDRPAGPAREELLLLVSTLERLFLGMHPYWGQEPHPLHVSMVRYDAPRFLRALPVLLRGRTNRHTTEAAGYRSHNVERLHLTLKGSWTLDGELYTADPATGPVAIDSAGPVTFLKL
jgi:hypothetical protein